MKRIILAVAALVVLSSSASAQPITGGGGLQRVIHDNTLTGEGTTPHPLGVSGAGGLISGTLTSPDLVVATGPHAVGNFAGSDPGACAAGSADTHPALSATGTLSKSCAVFVNAAGTGLSLSGSTLSLPNTGPGVSTVTYATISIDAQGRVTAASSGATPALAATTISAGTMLSGGGDLSANRTINLADIATSTVIGRVAAGTGAPSALTTTQLTTLVNPFSSTLSGAVPASGGSSTAFLNGAGGWTVPAGTGVTGTGTTNTTVKYTNGAGGVIGNAWPTDDATTWGVASRFTITEANGNFRSFGTGTIDGAATLTGGFASGTKSTLAYAASASTGNDRALDIALTGTFNTTGGNLFPVGINIAVSSTRSSGANNVNNVGADFSATGGQTNTALRTDGGDVILNATGAGSFTATAGVNVNSQKITNCLNGTVSSDGACFGQIATGVNAAVSGTGGRSARFSGTNVVGTGALTDDGTNITASAGTVTFSGATTINNGLAVNPTSTTGIYVNAIPAALAGNDWAVFGQMNGTINATSARVAYGVIGESYSAPSTGSSLTNVAGFFDATGGNTNIGLEVDRGNVILNNTSGTTTVSGALTASSTEHVVGAATLDSNLTAATGTIGLATTSGSTTIGNTSAAVQITGSQIDFHGSSADSYFYFGGTDTYIRGNGSTAQVFIGDNSTGGISLAKVGETTNVLDLLSVSYSQTAQAADIKAVNVSQSGTVDITATNRSSYGIKITNTTSKSAGNNSFAVYGVYSDTSGAGATNQIGNFGMFSNGGDVAVASGGTETHTLKFNGHENTGGTALVNADLSSCGTTPTIGTGSTDMAGLITEGTTATGCTLTYKGTYTVAPFCTCTGETSGGAAVLVGCSTTATTMVVANASATGDKIYYQCIGQRGGT